MGGEENEAIQTIFFGPDGTVIEATMERGPEDEIPDKEQWTKFLYWAADASPTGQALLVVSSGLLEHRQTHAVARRLLSAELPKPTGAGDLCWRRGVLYVWDWFSAGFFVTTPKALKPIILNALNAEDDDIYA